MKTDCNCSWKHAPNISQMHDGDCAINNPPHATDCNCTWHGAVTAQTHCTICDDTASKRRLQNPCVAKIHDEYTLRPSEQASRIKAFGKGRCTGIPGRAA